MFDRLFPRKHFADGRAMIPVEESAHWIAVCGTCGTEASLASMGATRYRAKGTPRKALPCGSCGQRRTMRIEWRPPS